MLHLLRPVHPGRVHPGAVISSWTEQPNTKDVIVLTKFFGLSVALVEIDRQMVNLEQARTLLETFRDVLE